MLTYATRVEFANRAAGEAVIAVQSKLTYYRVQVGKDYLTILGPGVDKELAEAELEALACFDSLEARALAAVLLFEAGE